MIEQRHRPTESDDRPRRIGVAIRAAAFSCKAGRKTVDLLRRHVAAMQQPLGYGAPRSYAVRTVMTPRKEIVTAEPVRCDWCKRDPLYIRYHDTEWGVPVHDDQLLFEFLVLEGAQAGLSWITILKKRDAYRKAFARFDPEKVARFDKRKIERLLQNAGIVRNRLKIESAVKNARAFLAVQDEFGSFARYQWRFVDDRPVQNRHRSIKTVPARTDVSDAFSKDLKQRGFSFVGTTIMYAHMQAVGMVNDHVIACHRYAALERAR